MKQLSVALAVYNEERYIGQCLDAVRELADEIVVVDGGSTDRTISIVKALGAQLIQTDNPAIFHINKQKALDLCTGKWILQLDADEIVTPKLLQEIKIIISSDGLHDGFQIPRRNIFWGHAMKKTGVYPDYVIRLFRNKKGKFPCLSVHEQIVIDGTIGTIKEPLLHYSYQTMADYWRKAASYTSLTADQLRKDQVSFNVLTWLRYTLIYPSKTFFSLYIRNQGFVDGVYGLLFSLFSSWHHPIAYWKYYLNMKKGKSI